MGAVTIALENTMVMTVLPGLILHQNLPGVTNVGKLEPQKMYKLKPATRGRAAAV
jgi:hypothetical protein